MFACQRRRRMHTVSDSSGAVNRAMCVRSRRTNAASPRACTNSSSAWPPGPLCSHWLQSAGALVLKQPRSIRSLRTIGRRRALAALSPRPWLAPCDSSWRSSASRISSGKERLHETAPSAPRSPSGESSRRQRAGRPTNVEVAAAHNDRGHELAATTKRLAGAGAAGITPMNTLTAFFERRQDLQAQQTEVSRPNCPKAHALSGGSP